jgi:hypothetical protein
MVTSVHGVAPRLCSTPRKLLHVPVSLDRHAAEGNLLAVVVAKQNPLG